MILELSDLVAIFGMMVPFYVGGIALGVKVIRLEQHCKDHTGFCNGD